MGLPADSNAVAIFRLASMLCDGVSSQAVHLCHDGVHMNFFDTVDLGNVDADQICSYADCRGSCQKRFLYADQRFRLSSPPSKVWPIWAHKYYCMYAKLDSTMLPVLHFHRRAY